MAKHPLPDQSTLLKLLRYEPDTGLLYFRERGSEWFSNSGRGGSLGQAARWNGRWANKAAGHINQDGYCAVRAPKLGGGGDSLLSHRVIWCMEKGSWPSDQIDHINHVRTDNRMANLREATNKINSRNQSMMSHNTSGICGVFWAANIGKWSAQIIVNGRRIYLGAFPNKDAAHRARQKADQDFGFHTNHGIKVHTGKAP